MSWSSSSNFWRALTASSSIIKDWLVWKRGSGRAIRIGSDPLVGSHIFFKLSKNVILKLKAQGIEYLAQVRSSEGEDISGSRWKKAEALGLIGDQKEDWNKYVKGLVSSGTILNNNKHTLLWSWDTKRDQVNAKLAYKVQMVELWDVDPCFWYSDLWN